MRWSYVRLKLQGLFSIQLVNDGCIIANEAQVSWPLSFPLHTVSQPWKPRDRVMFALTTSFGQMFTPYKAMLFDASSANSGILRFNRFSSFQPKVTRACNAKFWQTGVSQLTKYLFRSIKKKFLFHQESFWFLTFLKFSKAKIRWMTEKAKTKLQ